MKTRKDAYFKRRDVMYIVGVFRRTALWGILLLILSSTALQNTEILYLLVILGGAYVVISLFHILVCKIKNKYDSIGEIYFSALRADLIAPFSKISTLFAVLTRKWIVHDDSAFHNFADTVQVIAGGLWSMVILAIIVLNLIIIFL